MKDSGYFSTDQLPERTAYGYIKNPENNSWRTNFFAIPIIGMSDGGAYTTAADIATFWEKLVNNQLLSEETTRTFLLPHIKTSSKKGNIFYGYGVYVVKQNEQIQGYAICGGDPGVDFLSVVYPDHQVTFSALGNTEKNTWPLLHEFTNMICAQA
jgi:CubicO group peptidase (beta-lactamase class C family)